MTNKLQCVDCDNNERCTTYKIIENTLDPEKVHYKLSLQLNFIFTVNDPDNFKADFEDSALTIAEGSQALSELIKEELSDCLCITQQLGAEMNIGLIPNQQAFEELTEYVKVTHETSND